MFMLRRGVTALILVTALTFTACGSARELSKQPLQAPPPGTVLFDWKIVLSPGQYLPSEQRTLAVTLYQDPGAAGVTPAAAQASWLDLHTGKPVLSWAPGRAYDDKHAVPMAATDTRALTVGPIAADAFTSGGASDDLHCTDRSSKVTGTLPLPAAAGEFGLRLLPAGPVVLVSTHGLAGVDPLTCRQLWERTDVDGGLVGVFGDVAVLSRADSDVRRSVGINTRTGQTVWSVNDSVGSADRSVDPRRLLVFATGVGGGERVDPSTGKTAPVQLPPGGVEDLVGTSNDMIFTNDRAGHAVIGWDTAGKEVFRYRYAGDLAVRGVTGRYLLLGGTTDGATVVDYRQRKVVFTLPVTLGDGRLVADLGDVLVLTADTHSRSAGDSVRYQRLLGVAAPGPATPTRR
jgi:hypothetical protein